MPPPTLKWKRRKDGTAYSTFKGVEYAVSKTTAKHGLYPVYHLSAAGRRVASFAGEVHGKDACKRTASRLAGGAKGLYAKVTKGMKPSLRQALATTIETQVDYHWNGTDAPSFVTIPRAEGPYSGFFKKQAKRGLTPTNVLIRPDLVKKGKIDKDKLTPDYLASLYLELSPLWLPPVLEQRRKQDEEWEERRKKQLQDQAKAERRRKEKDEKKEEEDKELMRKERKSFRASGVQRPKHRASLPLRKVVTVVPSFHPAADPPKSAKWIEVWRWGETTRQVFQDKGYYITYVGLASAARTAVTKAFKSEERRDKFLRRLKIVYQEDADEERMETLALIAEVNKRARQKAQEELKKKEEERREKQAEAEKDSLGFHRDSPEGKVNKALSRKRAKTLATIEKETGVERGILRHLKELTDRGLVERRKGKRYRLTRKGLRLVKGGK